MKKPTPFGKYYLLERINVGGMAEVFRAKAFGVEGFERLVAVKRILPTVAEDRDFIRMFIDEAKLSVQLTHANIAQIFDLGVVDGSYYIALEHVLGRDLRAMFDRCRQLGEAMPIAQACFIAMKVCEGLDYAHNKRDQAGRELALVHRDVSPQNVLVSFEGEVKLIDFGIARAAGTAMSAQTGVRKGKFGYFSPEQVRGDAIDRRSDVFSCGIVLYELLTGERLFAGDSDLATLEKVERVEILPPSTYNRKIPDELERIVLKALGKDVGDRYQNAIDLHDELQAFVYTAGEFYARKDLAAWMKRTFGKEIEDETAKLDSYRQLRPPAPDPAAPVPEPIGAQPSQPSQGSARLPARKPVSSTKPPPLPVGRSQPVVMPVAQPAQAAAPVAPVALPARARQPELGWDDDELETRVYDGDDPRHKSNRTSLPLQPPVSSSPAIALPGDSSSDSSPDTVEVLPEDSFPQIAPATLESGARLDGAAAPASFAPGPQSLGPELPTDPVDSYPVVASAPGGHAGHGALAAPPGRRELSARHPAPSPAGPAADLPTLPVSSFGARITGVRRPGHQPQRLVAPAIAGVAIISVVVVAVIALSGRSKPAPAPAPPPVAARTPPPPPPPVSADPSTGFDLYVTPAGIMQWKLDGESRTDRLPSRIRGIAPGPHTVQIEPPPGFLSQHQQVLVEAGKASKVEIALQPIAGISGVFESTPPGAEVSVIVDGKRQPVGRSPARAALDPRSTYQVLFEKPGYVSVNRPLAFSGALEEHVIVNLERVAAPPAPAAPPRAPAAEPRPRRAGRTGADRPAPERAGPDGAAAGDPAGAAERAAPDDAAGEGKPGGDGKARAQGVLVLGSKPPCDIAIDGSPTGLHTPQKELKLPVGRHRITLSNSEFGISETFSVDVKADAPEKLIKDYSDRLPN